MLAYDNMRKIGKVSLVDDLPGYLRRHEIGPDALELAEQGFCERLKDRQGSVKAALMDQQIMAGIGNVYSDELLFHPRTHPKAAVGSLNRAELRRLFKAMRAVLEKAVECQADIDRFPRTWLLPHRGKHEKCPRCGHALRRMKVSGRTTYLCPRCQQRQDS